ncbi:MAG: hypothetical protein U0736_04555 [Gemmataceae bacterium]
MHSNELAFYTTRELIDELMRRQTFLGVVVHAEQEVKAASWSGDQVFQVHLNHHLEPAEAGRLLGAVAEHIDQKHG